MDRWKKLKDLAIVATAGVAAVSFSQQKPEKVQAATTTKAKKPASQLTTAQNKQKAAQKQVAKADKANKAANKAVKTAQNAVNTAGQKVADAQTAADANPVDAAQNKVNTANSQVTAAQDAENSAQTTADQAAKAASDQQGQVTTAQTKQKSAQAEVDKTGLTAAESKAKAASDKASQAAKTASDAKAKQEASQKAANSASQQVSDTNDQLTAKNKEKDSAQSAVNSAQAASNNANSKKSDQEKTVADAKNAQSAAQKALNDVNLSGAQNDKNNAEKAANNANNAEKDAENALNRATAKASQTAAALTSAQNAKNAADSEVNSDQQKANSAQTAYNSAKSAYDQAQSKLNNSQAAQKAAQQAYDTYPTINANAEIKAATQKYAEAERAYYKSSTSANLEAMNQAKTAWAKAIANGANLSQYLGKDADQQVKVDLNNLTAEQQTELSQYAAALINSARESFGMVQYAGKASVSKGAMAAAGEIAKKYANDKWNSFENGHDNDAVNSVAKDYGLIVPDSGQGIENLFTSAPAKNVSSLYAVKADIFKAVNSMLYQDADSDYGHAVSLLGLDAQRYSNAGSNMTTYFGLGTNTAELDGYFGNTEQFHLIVVPNGQETEVGPDADGYYTIYPSPVTNASTWQSKQGTQSLASTYNLTTLKANLDNANTALASAQADYNTKVNAYSSAKSVLDAANTALANAKNNQSAKATALTKAQSAASAATTAKTNAATALTAAKISKLLLHLPSNQLKLNWLRQPLNTLKNLRH